MVTGFSESPRFYPVTMNCIVLCVFHFCCNTSVPVLYLSRPAGSLQVIKSLHQQGDAIDGGLLAGCIFPFIDAAWRW